MLKHTFQLLDEFNRPVLKEPLPVVYSDPAEAKLEALVAHADYVFRNGKRARVRLEAVQ